MSLDLNQSKDWLVSLLSLESFVPFEDNILIVSIVIFDCCLWSVQLSFVYLLTYCFVSQIFKNLNALHTFPFSLNLFKWLVILSKRLPWWLSKEYACSAGGVALTPGLGRSHLGEPGNPLKSSCLTNPHGQKSLVGYSPWGRKESDAEQLNTYITFFFKVVKRIFEFLLSNH